MLWIVGALAVCGGMLYVAYNIEPHWVAKDGSRFLTTSELVDEHGRSISRRKEVRGAFLPDGTLAIGSRSLARTRSTPWRLRLKSPSTDRGRLLYILDPIDSGDGADAGEAADTRDCMVLRVPPSSRLVPTLDGLLAQQTGDAPA